jgi:hypothetical protein
LRCLNCKGEHVANDKKCVYKRHENNRSWHDRRAVLDKEEARVRREEHSKVIKQVHEAPEIIEVSDSSS